MGGKRFYPSWYLPLLTQLPRFAYSSLWEVLLTDASRVEQTQYIMFALSNHHRRERARRPVGVSIHS